MHYNVPLSVLDSIGINASVQLLESDDAWFFGVKCPVADLDESPSAHGTAYPDASSALQEGILHLSRKIADFDEEDLPAEFPEISKSVQEELDRCRDFDPDDTNPTQSGFESDGTNPTQSGFENSTRKSTEIEPHPLLQKCWLLDEASPEFQALLADIGEKGVQTPIEICVEPSTGAELIIDGRHRWLCAGILDIVFPIVTHPPELAAQIMLERNTLRKHYPNKGAQAYDLAPIVAEAVKNGKKLREANLKNSPRSGESAGTTLKSLAAKLGISEDTLGQALKIHKWPASRQQPWIEKIRSGQVGLGAVIAGDAGRNATAGGNRSKVNPGKLLCEGFISLGKRFAYWDEIPEEEREPIIAEVADLFEKMPDGLKEAARGAIA